MAFSISYIYELVDKYSAKSAKIAANSNKGQRSMKAYVEKTTKAYENQEKVADKLGSIMATGAAALAAAAPVKFAVEYESAMSDVLKVVSFGEGEFEKFNTQIKNMAKETGQLPADIALLAAAGGRLGYSGAKLTQFTELSLKAAIAFDMGAEQAGDSIASFSNKLKLSIDDMEGFLDTVNFLADNTAAKSADMIEILERTSGTMGLIKAPKGFVTAMAAVGSQLETSAELGASGVNMMLNRMALMPDLSKKLQVDAKGTVLGVLEKFRKIAPEKQMAAITKEYGAEAGKFVAKLVSNSEVVDKAFDLAASEKSVGSMTNEFNQQMKTTQAFIDRAKASFVVLGISIGNFALPAIKALGSGASTLAGFLDNLTQKSPILTGTILALTAAVIGGKIAFLAGGAALSAYRSAVIITATSVSTLKNVMNLLAIAFAANPIGLAVAAAALLAAGAYAVYQNWDKVVEVFKNIGEWAKGIGAEIMAFFGGGDKDVTLTTKNVNENIASGAGQNIAASSAANQQLNANGQIVVSATGGAQVQSASLATNAPGNLGMNIAHAGVQ